MNRDDGDRELRKIWAVLGVVGAASAVVTAINYSPPTETDSIRNENYVTESRPAESQPAEYKIEIFGEAEEGR